MSNEQANLSLMRRLYEDYGRGETGSLFDALI